MTDGTALKGNYQGRGTLGWRAIPQPRKAKQSRMEGLLSGRQITGSVLKGCNRDEIGEAYGVSQFSKWMTETKDE